MSFEIRKIVTYSEETRIEGGKATDKPVTMVGLAVVIKNPWAGRGFVEDLKPEIRANCSELGALMVERLTAAIGGADVEGGAARAGRRGQAHGEGEVGDAGIALVGRDVVDHQVRQVVVQDGAGGGVRHADGVASAGPEGQRDRFIGFDRRVGGRVLPIQCWLKTSTTWQSLAGSYQPKLRLMRRTS